MAMIFEGVVPNSDFPRADWLTKVTYFYSWSKLGQEGLQIGNKSLTSHALHLSGTSSATGLGILNKFQKSSPERRRIKSLCFPGNQFTSEIRKFLFLFWIKESKIKLKGLVTLPFRNTTYRGLKMILYLNRNWDELVIFSVKKRRKLMSGKTLLCQHDTIFSQSDPQFPTIKSEGDNVYFKL